MKKFLLLPWSTAPKQPTSLLALAVLTRFFLCCIPEAGATTEQGTGVEEESLAPLRATVTWSEANNSGIATLTFPGFATHHAGSILRLLEETNHFINTTELSKDCRLELNFRNFRLTGSALFALWKYVSGAKITETDCSKFLREHLTRIDLSENLIGDEEIFPGEQWACAPQHCLEQILTLCPHVTLNLNGNSVNTGALQERFQGRITQ